MNPDFWPYFWINIWYALAGIGTILLAIMTSLSLIKLDSQVSIMRSQAKISQLNEEMTKLVSPLKSRKDGRDGKYYFDLNPSSFAPERLALDFESDSNYFEFWYSIKINMYLGPDYLWASLYRYMDAKEIYFIHWKDYTFGYARYRGIQFDKSEESKEIIRNFKDENELLKSQIDRRYFEIRDELEKYQKFEETIKNWWG